MTFVLRMIIKNLDSRYKNFRMVLLEKSSEIYPSNEKTKDKALRFLLDELIQRQCNKKYDPVKKRVLKFLDNYEHKRKKSRSTQTDIQPIENLDVNINYAILNNRIRLLERENTRLEKENRRFRASLENNNLEETDSDELPDLEILK